MHRTITLVLLLLTASLAGCLGSEPAPGASGGDPFACTAGGVPTDVDALTAPGKLQATVETSEGSFTMELYADKVPVTVANFVRYAHEGFYNGTIFHRVIEGFMNQGGGFTPDLQQKTTHDPIPLDRHPELSNDRGTVAMARTKSPHSATSQFFVNVADNPNLDKGAGYAVFGKVVEGMDVVDRINKVPTHKEQGMSDVPKEDVVIRSVSVQLPDVEPDLAVVPLQSTYCRDGGSALQVPFQVQNGWDASRTVEFEAGGDATELTVPVAEDGASLELAPGRSVLVLVTVPASDGEATATLKATSGDLQRSASSTVEATGPGNTTAGKDAPKVTADYAALLRSGVPYVTNMDHVGNHSALRTAYGQGQGGSPLKVFVGSQDQAPKGYLTMPGLQDVARGLHGGESGVGSVDVPQGQSKLTLWFVLDVAKVSG